MNVNKNRTQHEYMGMRPLPESPQHQNDAARPGATATAESPLWLGLPAAAMGDGPPGGFFFAGPYLYLYLLYIHYTILLSI